MFIENLKWLYSAEAEVFSKLAEIRGRHATDPDTGYLLNDLAHLHRRVLSLQRSVMAMAIGLAFLGLGELLRFAALMLG